MSAGRVDLKANTDLDQLGPSVYGQFVKSTERASERTSWSSQSYLNEPIWVTGLSWSGRRDSRIEMKEDGRKEGKREPGLTTAIPRPEISRLAAAAPFTGWTLPGIHENTLPIVENRQWLLAPK